jgi:general secretion pathway protein F
MVSGLMVYVVPDMVAVIIESGQELPLATQILIRINEVVANFWWLIAGFGFSVFVITRWLLRSPKPRLLWDKAKFSLPLVARITKNSNAAGYTNTLSILTRSGLPLVESMHIASDVVANAFLKVELQQATQSVTEGASLADSLGKIGQFPPMVVHMISAGEQSGDLDVMLSRVASYQQNEVERVVSALVKLVEPLMLLIMGGIVMFIVIAILLPMLSMNQLV